MNKLYFNRLTKALQESNIDAMLISPSPELKFILGKSPLFCERFQGLFVKNTGECFYVCNLLTAGEMKDYLGDEVKVYDWFDGNVYTDVVGQALQDYGLIGKQLAVNAGAQICNLLNIAKMFDLKLLPGKDMLEEIRIIKTDEELEIMQESSHIADKVFADMVELIKPKMKEEDIVSNFPRLFQKHGGWYNSCVVACGANSSYPHYNDNQGMVKEQDVVLLDFGGYYEGMRSDMTRTVFVGGITDEQKRVYEIVRAANAAGEAAAFAGAYIPDVDKAARNVIDRAGYGKFFTTRLGHGIGYMGHEAPDIKQSHDRHLEMGMTFSIEPGIYLTGNFGVRIEDIVGITASGTVIFNQADKDIIVL